jgi:mono/diheme cytochrome c family protein
MKKYLVTIGFLSTAIVAMVGCSEIRRKPGKIYVPDMAYSRAYETYSTNPVYADNQTNRLPVEGTVKRGAYLPFRLPKDAVGDTANYFASRQIQNPLPPLDSAGMVEAERIYLIHCGICHGAKLDGNGPLYKGGDGPYPLQPAQLVGNAKYEEMPAGQMFYSVTYGKNLMGSYASQLDVNQRWQVIHYIKKKQNKPVVPAAPAAPATTPDSTAVATK